jgi:hypothetical protein
VMLRMRAISAWALAFAAQVRFVRIADLHAKRSEGPLSVLHVEMCMAQHL